MSPSILDRVLLATLPLVLGIVVGCGDNVEQERRRHCERVAVTLSTLQVEDLTPRDFHLLLAVLRSDVFYCVRPADKAENLLNSVLPVKTDADIDASLERLRVAVQP